MTMMSFFERLLVHNNKGFHKKLDMYRLWKTLCFRHKFQPKLSPSTTTPPGPSHHAIWSSEASDPSDENAQVFENWFDKEYTFYKLPSVTSQMLDIRKWIRNDVENALGHILEVDKSIRTSTAIARETYPDEIQSSEDIMAERWMKPFHRSVISAVSIPDPEQILREEDLEESRYFDAKDDVSKISREDLELYERMKMEVKMGDEKLKLLRQLETKRMNQMQQEFKQRHGWVPVVRKSDIVSRRRGRREEGLFIDGRVKKGSIIGFFPGMVYGKGFRLVIRKRSKELEDDLHLKNLNNHVSTLIDGPEIGAYINGSLENERFFNTMYNHDIGEANQKENSQNSDKLSASIVWNSAKSFIQAKDDEMKEFLYGHHVGMRYMHPLAQIHKVNHPPKNCVPNAYKTHFIVPFDMDPSLLPYIPNKIYRPPPLLVSSKHGLMRCIIYIARRDIENEEIFVNYRLDPHNLPSWYYPYNALEDNILWGK